MKRIGIVVAGVAALAMGIGASAWAARAPANTISTKQKEQGMAEAPAAVALAKVPCTVSDAYFINSGKDPETKVDINYYEVACSGALGYIVEAKPDTARAFDCLTIKTQAEASDQRDPLMCRLEGNADPKMGLASFITTAGRTCTVTDARVMGSTAAGDSFYEAACGAQPGFVIKTSVSGQPTEVIDCAQLMGQGTACTLTTKDQIVAGFAQQVSQGGGTCATPTDGRYVGSSPENSFFEVACGAGQGYMISVKNDGAFEQAIECTKAQGVGGGCTLTDTAVAEEQEAATYTGLAKSAGFDCNVDKYRFIGVDQNSKSEVVELSCGNRPDGGVALFPTAAGEKGKVYDCVVGASIGVSCALSQPQAVFAKYTQGLVSQNRTTCKVSNAKWLAATTSGSDLIETACADGDPGYVMSVARESGQVNELLTCTQARNAGAPCTFPTNTANR